MAEFKLGRIKFVYQGTWTTSHSYSVDDVVTNGGKTYICVISHTSSSAFATDLAGITGVTKWNLIADGSTWRNTWAATTYYNLGDIVLWGATVYICKTAHTSQTYLEDDLSKWDIFSAGFKWLGAWATSTRYKVRDLVFYGGSTYVCNTQHTSASTAASGLENDLSKWDIFNQSITYLGAWSGSSVRYKLNDVVKFGADLWICTAYHTSTGTSIDTGNFAIFVNGFEFMNSYSGSTAYIVGDVVTYGGYTYTAIQNSTGQTPSTATSYWKVFTSGLTYSGEWDTGTSYKIGNVVTRGGYTYVAKADNSASTPPSSNWGQLSSGIRWNAAANTTYTNVASSNVSSSGTGSPTFTITRTGTVYSAIIGSTAGAGYAVNDTLKVLGSALGGASPGNDLVVKVATITGGGATGPIGIVTISSGYAATWKTGITYVVGDAVYYGNSSFICISSHIGSTGVNDPITDTGTYWNTLSSGADTGALTTQGDMVYYGANGPVRLPIGTDGQVLRVNGNQPSWSYYGQLQNVVYVAPTGVDSSGNGQGLTLDKPWASLLYACRQVEEGYLNTNAGLALKVNKQFMMKEVNNFILVNYSFNITGTSASGNTFIVGGSSTTSQTTTANMYYGMPITFSAATGGVTAGQVYYVNTILNTTTFTISEVYQSGQTRAISPSSSTASTVSFNYTQSKAERDTGTVIDGTVFDLTHGGNLYSVTATQSYFKTLTSFTSTGTTQQSPVFAASLVYLKDTLFPAILTNSAPAVNYQTINGVTATSQAVQNTTGVVTTAIETNTLSIAQGLLSIITSALAAGTYGNIPQLSRPHTTVYLKTGTYNEYGPIVIPLDTSIVGDELRSTIVQVAKPQTYLGTDKPKTSSAIRRIKDLIPAIVNNVPVRTTTGVTATQQYINGSAQTLATTTQSIVTNVATLQSILAGGLTALPGYAVATVTTSTASYSVSGAGSQTLSTPTGFGSSLTNTAYSVTGLGVSGYTGNVTGATTGYDSAVTNINANILFLQREVAAYLEGYSGSGFSWTALTTTQQSQTLRDIAFLLQSVKYDLTYGGNTQSQIDGLAYWSLTNNTLTSAAIIAGTTAALTRVQTVIPYIINGTTAGWTKSANNNGTQVLSVVGTNANAALYAQALIGNVINWINGTNTPASGGSLSTGAGLAGTVLPALSWESAANLTAYSTIQAQRTYIQTQIQTFVATQYATVVASLDLTYRDAGTIIDALSYDMLLGTNYFSIVAGRAFYRANASAQALIGSKELQATQDSIDYISYILGSIASNLGTLPATVGDAGNTSAVNLVVTNTRVIQDMFAGGGVITGPTNTNYPNGLIHQPAISMPTVTGYNSSYLANYGDAVTLIKANYQFIKDEIVTFLAADSNLTGSAQWSAYSSTYQAETTRDLGFILDAICYDMTYGCNSQSLILGSSYYSLNTAQLFAPYLLGVTESLGRLSTIIGQIVQKTSVSASLNNSTTQYTTGTAGSAAAAAFAQARVADIVYWINNGIADSTAATFTGSITTTTLTVSSVTGTIKIGQIVTGGTVAAGTYITAGSGSSWTVSVSQSATATGSTLVITPITSGAYALATTANRASYDAIQARASEVANDAQSWVTRFYQNESPILSLTNRDAGYVVSALAYDVLFGSNFQSIQCGRSYNRLVTSVVNLQTNLADSTYGALGFIGERVKLIAANGATAQTQAVVDEMLAQIAGQPTTTATFNGTITSTQLVVNGSVTGTIAIGMQLSGTGIATGTTIVSGSGTTWLLNYNQSAASTTTNIISVTTSVTLNGNAYNNVLTAGTTSGFVPGLTITLTGTTIGNLTAGTYYIKQVLSSTQFTVSQNYLGSVFTINSTAQGAMTAVVYGIYGGLGLTTDITASGTTIPVTTVTTATNLITVSTNANMLVNMPIVFTGLPANITTTATTISSSSITLGATVASLGVVVGQKVWFTGFTPQATGTSSTIVANQIYYVKTASSSAITIAATLNGTALVLANATGLTLTANFNAAGGLVPGNIYWINSVTAGSYPSAGTTITVTNSYKSGTAFVITNTVGSLTATCTAGMPINQGINDKNTNGTIQPWNNAIGSYGSTTGYNNTLTTINGAELIRANKTFLATEAVEYVRSVFSGTVTTTLNTGTITCSGAHNLSVGDPVVLSASPIVTTITATAVSGNNITVNTTAGLVANTVITFSDNLGNLQAGVPYYILTAVSTTITVSTTFNGQVFAAGSATGSVTGTVRQYVFDNSIVAGTVYWVLTTPTSSTLTLTITAPGTGTQTTKTLTGSNGAMTITYYIRTTQAIRDASLHIDGLIYDLGLTGNYKSTRSAQLYLTAQSGATVTDLFHLRNGTGLRNMTLNGMTGAMSLPNSLGTKRPTAGSYSSLDAGFGPNDANAWISYRSPYTQNLTLFGSGCAGMKIDAALHNGGNKSIVANDYTTIISDGLGVWCTGSGALTELVSVFAYYSYAGYLAEYGGRIRATNGNSSYGTYGVIAEGIDSYETPIYGRLNNRASSAYITNVVTDSTDKILRLEFENAGSAYTNAIPSVNGAGYNIVTIGDEFRDSAVFETRLVDLNNGQGTGGSNYLTASNVAQTGAVGSITIANSDIQLSSAYVGMRIQLIGGTGVGQYANIIGYAQSNKLANIVRPSFATLTITTNSTTVFTVASTATMYVGQPIYMAAPIGGLSTSGSGSTTTYAPTVYYVSTTSFSSTQFRLSTTAANAAAGTNITLTATSATPAVTAASIIVGYTLTVGTLTSGVIYPGMLLTGGSILPNTYVVANISGSGAGSTWVVSVSQNLASTALTGTVAVPVYEAGWDHVVPGNTVQPLLDATSAYIIEPALAYSAPGFTSTAISMSPAVSTTWSSVAYGQGTFVAVSNATGVASTAKTTDGITWSAGGALPTDSSSKWNRIVYGGGQNATATAVVGGVGGSGAVLTAVVGAVGTNLAGQIISISIVNGGYNYTTPPTIVITDATGAGATATARVLNGSIQAVDMIITGSLYATPTITAVTSSLSSITATTWGSGYYATPLVNIAAPFTATGWSSGGTATSGSYYSAVDTTVSPNVTNYYLVSGSGTFSATKPTFTNGVYGKSGYGASGVGASATYGVTITYVGTLAVASANTNTNAAGYGVTSYTISQTGYGYTSNPTITVTDPNAAFMAISSATSSAAYSTDQGASWTATVGNTGKTNLNSLAYGNNLYVAIGGTSSAAAVSYSPGNASSLSTTTWSDQSSYITANSSGYSYIAYGAGVFCAIGGTVSSFMAADPTKWYAGATLPSKTWVGIAYGNGRFVALASDGTLSYTNNWQSNGWTVTPSNAANNTWTTVLNNPLFANGVTTWSRIKYGQGLFIAISNTQAVAISSDGLNWTYYATGMPSSSNWLGLAFGNPKNATLGAVPTWVAVSNTSGQIATRIQTGARPQARARVVNNQISEVRMIEPGSGFPRGNVTATSTTSTGTITVDNISNLTANQPILFGASAGNIVAGTYYFVKGTPASTSGLAGTIQISTTAGGSVFALTASTPTGMTYFAGPIITQTDPNKVNTAPLAARIGNGALGNPSFANRGTANTTGTASYSGDGYADLYQVGQYVNVTGLYQIPTAGCNVVFNSITGTSRWYKLVAVTNVLGIAGNYTATFQINPGLSTLLAPAHNDLITTNLSYSNVRLTGHDFLYIGTGGFSATNYPYVDATKAVSANQELFVGGGRVFFTSTDQDGNFNVGNLFGVQQSTGTATLNASAFNLSGLQSLTLGSVSLGVGSATIYQFSTDPYFTANSDGVVPTQKAIKAFITAQIGGGQSSLNVNTITSGQIYIAGNTISNTNNVQIYVGSKMTFTGGIDGAPVALAYFGQK